MRLVLLPVLLLAFALPHFSQTADELHASVRAALGEHRLADASSGLRAMAEKYPARFRELDHDYLAARIEERSGDPGTAAALYLAVAKRGSVLKPYALYHLAAIARGSGDLVVERTYLDEIAAFSPGSLLADAANHRRARSWFESGNYPMAIKAFQSLLSSAGRTAVKGEQSINRENRLYLARAYMLSGDTAAAREQFATLVGTVSNPSQPDDFALAAVSGLDKLDRTPDVGERSVPKLGDYEHLRRASVYQFNRDFSDARLHYDAIVRDHPTSGIVPDAIFQTGRGYAQEGSFPDAIRSFERVIEQFPAHPVSRDALLQAAAAYARVGKPHESVKRYQDFIAKYPGDERLDRAHLNIIDALRDSGEESEALRWSARTQELFRGKVPESLALFSEVRINLARSDWDAAGRGLDRLSQLPDLGGVAVAGGTNKAEVTFLRGLVLEQKREFAAAIDVYLSIPDGRSEYYGWRATERLREMAASETAKTAVGNKLSELLQPPSGPINHDAHRQRVQSALRLTADPAERGRLLGTLRGIYANLPAYKNVPSYKLVDLAGTEAKGPAAATRSGAAHRAVADRLLFLGLFDEAAPEFEAAQQAAPTANSDLAYTIAVMNQRGDHAYKAVAFAEPAWRAVPADYQVELMPREQISLLYPAPYRDAFGKYAGPRGVDPRFLLSIVRQESRYRPDIKSYAAARGMMQFISTTSDKIAAELGRADFDQDELYDASTAILFGSQYASNLFKLFPNQPDAVAASYNGGEDNMRRWMNRSRSDAPGRYVPEIAFSQTKDYVYKVMANYRVYQLFYKEDLTAEPPR